MFSCCRNKSKELAPYIIPVGAKLNVLVLDCIEDNVIHVQFIHLGQKESCILHIAKYQPSAVSAPGQRLAHIIKNKWVSITCLGYTTQGFALVDAVNKRNLDIADYMIFRGYATSAQLI